MLPFGVNLVEVFFTGKRSYRCCETSAENRFGGGWKLAAKTAACTTGLNYFTIVRKWFGANTFLSWQQKR